ncbi:hypothetical protein Pelo_10979 [Pelomyxa schiedti]|nr:hypothetical protein Pelo_10979 [Pelomyxa schiedti]
MLRALCCFNWVSDNGRLQTLISQDSRYNDLSLSVSFSIIKCMSPFTSLLCISLLHDDMLLLVSLSTLGCALAFLNDIKAEGKVLTRLVLAETTGSVVLTSMVLDGRTEAMQPQKEPIVAELEALGFVVERWEEIKFSEEAPEMGEGVYGKVLRGVVQEVVMLQLLDVILEWVNTDLWQFLHCPNKADKLPSSLLGVWNGYGWPWYLKPSNCLVDRRFTGKICDLGTARCAPFALTARDLPGTYLYLGPEVMKLGAEATTFKLDMQVPPSSVFCTHSPDSYSLGLILFELVTEKQPFVEYFRGVQDERDPKYKAAVGALYKGVMKGDRPKVPERFPIGPDIGERIPEALRPTITRVVHVLETLYEEFKENLGDADDGYDTDTHSDEEDIQYKACDVLSVML